MTMTMTASTIVKAVMVWVSGQGEKNISIQQINNQQLNISTMDKNEMREVIAKRAAKELHDGDVVNLGIGIPTLIPNYLPPSPHRRQKS